MRKNTLLLLIIGLIIIASITGCTQSQSITQSATQTSPTSQPTVENPPATQTTLTNQPTIENSSTTSPTVIETNPPFIEDKAAIAQMKFPRATNITEISYVEPDVVYGVAGGIELKMDIYYPKEFVAKVPVVIYVHGGAFQSGDKRDGIVAGWMPEIVSRGYMVASLNYRLVPQGGTFPYQVQDVKTAVRWLRGNAAKYRIDTTKIGIIGGSSGGYLVNMMGLCDANAGFDSSGGYLDQSSRVQAVVDLYGISDIEIQYNTGRIEGPGGPVSKFINNTNNFTQVASIASPINYVTTDDPPFLIMHGDKDTDVIPKQSEMLYDKLREANVPATLVWVKNGGHGFVQVGQDPISPSFTEILKTTADFFDKYLKQ
jgi:acetyl esterase/lipase